MVNSSLIHAEPGTDTPAAPAIALDMVEMSFTVRRGKEKHKLVACSNVTLDVADGSFVAFLGPSGCGKSTLLRIIDGLLTPTAGEVQVYGRPVSGPGTDKAMVFQHHNLFPWRTVVANVEFGLQMAGVGTKERRERAIHYLELVGLAEFRDSYPHQLSGGMAQRVGLARALAVEPRILLMDEPFGALDAQTRFVMQEELSRIWAEHRRTVVFVTHDIDEALFLADRVFVFSTRPGRVIEELDLPFGRPRGAELRGNPEVARLKDHIWQQLRPAAELESRA